MRKVFISVSLDRAENKFHLCWVFFYGFHALFTELASTEFNKKKNFKTGSHMALFIFKNYFATAFSVFNF